MTKRFVLSFVSFIFLFELMSECCFSQMEPRLERISEENYVGPPYTMHTVRIQTYNIASVVFRVTGPNVSTTPFGVNPDENGVVTFTIRLGGHGESHDIRAVGDGITALTFSIRGDRDAEVPPEWVDSHLGATFEYPEARFIDTFTLKIGFSGFIPINEGVGFISVTGFQPEDITVETELTDGSGTATLEMLMPSHPQGFPGDRGAHRLSRRVPGYGTFVVNSSVPGVFSESYAAQVKLPPLAAGRVRLTIKSQSFTTHYGWIAPAGDLTSEWISFNSRSGVDPIRSEARDENWDSLEIPMRMSYRCGLGWVPESQYQHFRDLPKVMMYALEFEYDPDRNAGYSCKAIEIRTGDDAIENLAGWKLYLGRLYNPSHTAKAIPEAHSQITGGVLRLTPEMLGLETFPCNTVYASSHPLPGVHYELWTDENVLVDTAYSCFIWGLNATTTVNRVNVKSPRRVSSVALCEMETPRLERYILDDTSIYITYMDIEAFTWDRAVFSDWLLPPSEDEEVSVATAPSHPYVKMTTLWGQLKRE